LQGKKRDDDEGPDADGHEEFGHDEGESEDTLPEEGKILSGDGYWSHWKRLLLREKGF